MRTLDGAERFLSTTELAHQDDFAKHRRLLPQCRDGARVGDAVLTPVTDSLPNGGV